MKKIILIMIIPILLLGGCLHKKDRAPVTGSVTVKGNIENDAIVLRNLIPSFIKEAFAASFVSTRSTLTVTDPERFTDISRSSSIVVEADVINSTAAKLNGYKVDVLIEDEIFLTKENWSCHVCYPFDGGGEDCEIIWSVDGNNLFETEPAPSLEMCQAGAGTQELCVTKFKDGVNCSSPRYFQEYTDKGDGLQRLSIPNITVEALNNFLVTTGVGANNWQTGTDKYARFIVYNETSVEVARKDYVFNVMQ